MGVLEELFAQYSVETILVFIVSLAVCLKFLGEIWDYYYAKLRKYFNYKNQQDQDHSEIIDGIQQIKEMEEELGHRMDRVEERIAKLENDAEKTAERLQENSKSYIIDKHHYFCYTIKAIDDLNLQSLERRYLFYKGAGGDTFIDGLMDEIRSLPRVTLHDKN